MSDIVDVKALKRAGLSADGQSALIMFDAPAGPVTLSLREEKLGGLFGVVCGSISELAEKRTGRRQTLVLEPQSWSLAPLASGRLGVTFVLDGTELTFAVPNSQIAGVIQALQKLLADTTPPSDPQRH